MLDIYDPNHYGDEGSLPWITLSRHMGQLCFILTKTFKGF